MTLLMMAYWHHLVALKPYNANLGGVVFYVDGAKPLTTEAVDQPLTLQKAQISLLEETARVRRVNFIGTIDDFRSIPKN